MRVRRAMGSWWGNALVGASVVMAPAVAGAQQQATNAGRQDSAPVTAPAETMAAHLRDAMGRAGGLTADQVAQRAVATSFDVRARHDEVLAAAAAVDQALVAFIPRLQLAVSYNRLSYFTPPSLGLLTAPADQNAAAGPIYPSTAPNQMGTTQLINLPFVLPVLENQTYITEEITATLTDYFLRYPQLYNGARHAHRANELSEQVTRLRVATDARVAYYGWVRAKLQSIVTQQALMQSRDHLNDVQHLFQAGSVSQADVLLVQSQVASAELLVERANNLAEAMLDRVRVAMHVPATTMFEVGEDMMGDTARAADAGTFAALLDEAYAHRLEIRGLTEAIDANRDQATVAEAAYYPRVTAHASVLTADPNPRYFPPTDVFNTTWEIGAAVSWSPNDLANAVYAHRSAETRVANAEAQRESVRDGLRAEVLSAFQAAHEASVALDTTARGLVAAEESYRVRRVLFQNGRATSVELSDTETDLTRARLEAINARVDQRVAAVRLVHAIGHDVNTNADAPAR